jgi:hypothetical protein
MNRMMKFVFRVMSSSFAGYYTTGSRKYGI